MSAPDFDTLEKCLREARRYNGRLYSTCPLCSTERKSRTHRKARVLRLRPSQDGNLIGYLCYHCGADGYALRDGPKSRATQLPNVRLQSDEAERRRKLARYLWRTSRPAPGTPAEAYLRGPRGITCAIPATVRYLPASGEYPHALIAPFALPLEREPGILAFLPSLFVHAVHLISLNPDGSGKADIEIPKRTIGSTDGMPIVLAPPNDLGALIVYEGIENALSAHQAHGIGAWASGGWSFLPRLSAALAQLWRCGAIEHLTINVDDDPDGQRNAYALAAAVEKLTRSPENGGRPLKILLGEAPNEKEA